MDEFSSALERATKLLGIRARSRRELGERLSRTGYSPVVIEEVDAYLAELGLVDDEEFALQRVRHLLRRGRSSRSITDDLALSGLEDAAVEAASSELELQGSDSDRAVTLAMRRAQSCRGLAGEKAFARVARYLCSKGYEPEVAREACEQVFGGARMIDPPYGHA